MSIFSPGREERDSPGGNHDDLEDTVTRISAGADERDLHPSFPEDPFMQLAAAGTLALPVPDPIEKHGRRASFAQEWRVLRAVARADGSVGRILDGHFNGTERVSLLAPEPLRSAELEAIAAGELLLGVWGADPVPGEGEPARLVKDEHGVRLFGVKTFCSGSTGLDRALVVVRGASPGPPLLAYVGLSEGATVDTSWFKGAGCGPRRAIGSSSKRRRCSLYWESPVNSSGNRTSAGTPSARQSRGQGSPTRQSMPRSTCWPPRPEMENPTTWSLSQLAGCSPRGAPSTAGSRAQRVAPTWTHPPCRKSQRSCARPWPSRAEGSSRRRPGLWAPIPLQSPARWTARGGIWNSFSSSTAWSLPWYAAGDEPSRAGGLERAARTRVLRGALRRIRRPLGLRDERVRAQQVRANPRGARRTPVSQGP